MIRSGALEEESRRKLMAGKIGGKDQTQSGTNAPGPDVMLGLWASWMDRISAPAQAAVGQGRPWWQMTTDVATPDVLAGGVKQLEEGLSNDPTLRSIDQMWNANPLREVVPIDWAEIARALRVVWLRSLRKPETAKAIGSSTPNCGARRSRFGTKPASAGWAWPTRPRRKGRCPPPPTSGSPRPSGTRTPSIARSRRSISSRRTG